VTLLGYLRTRSRLWAVAGLWGGVLLIGFDLYAAVVTYIPGYRVRDDFRLIYGASLAALRHGYDHLYDLAAQKDAVEGLGTGFYWSPFLNPPPLVWIATPFTVLPFDIAIVAWTVLLLIAAVAAWYLVAPGGRIAKAAHLALWLGLFPVAFGLMVGQPVALVALAVAACWWLAQRNRSVLAGLALSLVSIKPQVALLVPLCLLVSGHARVFGTWLIATLLMVLVALALLGPDGVTRYREVLALASQWEPTRRYAIAGPLGTGPQLYVVQAIVIATTVFAAWRQRHAGIGTPIAIGIIGSLLFTPYVGFQDFAMLIVAGWLIAHAQPSPWQIALMIVGYALLELALLVMAIPILLAEVLLLVSLLARAPAEPPGDLRRVHRIVSGQVADQ
jgi:Glycosyltransferase family 87